MNQTAQLETDRREERFRIIELRLRRMRILGWPLFLIELSLMAGAARFVLSDFHDRPEMLYMLLVMGGYYALSMLMRSAITDAETCVSQGRDRWQIGKYRESDIRRLAKEAFQGLPFYLRKARIIISKHREANAFTFIARILPSLPFRKRVVLSSGCLHYLEPPEIQGVLLHEIAHHHPRHRVVIPGGWFFLDLAYYLSFFWVVPDSLSFFQTLYCFTGYRLFVCIISAIPLWDVSPIIEYKCDLFAAKRVGHVTMTNTLLKLGEESELSEIVLERAIRNLGPNYLIDLEDVVEAFNEVRPYGRIFHENLFKHSHELVKEIVTQEETCETDERRNEHLVPEVREFLEKRANRPKKRLRWRSFDREGKGFLTPEAIDALCRELQAKPDHVLVDSLQEQECDTHPPYRDRILHLHDRLSG